MNDKNYDTLGIVSAFLMSILCSTIIYAIILNGKTIKRVLNAQYA